MAKSFASMSKGLGLLDFFTFGKYKNCRVDSILEQDPSYIAYSKANFGTVYAKEVLALLPSKIEGVHSLSQQEQERQIRRFHGSYNPATKDYELFDEYLEDMPF